MGLFGTSASHANTAKNTDAAHVADKKAPRGLGKAAPQERILRDENVTLSESLREGRPAEVPRANLALKEYKFSVAQDAAFVRETLRHKLAEYEMPAGTRMGISKDAIGHIEIDSRMPDEVRGRIEQDLNQSQAFKTAFDRLSVNQPTLDYVDTVMKLSQAYGTRNSLFDSLISRDGSFNGLQDIAHRYQSVGQTLSRETTGMETMGTSEKERYQLSLNA